MVSVFFVGEHDIDIDKISEINNKYLIFIFHSSFIYPKYQEKNKILLFLIYKLGFSLKKEFTLLKKSMSIYFPFLKFDFLKKWSYIRNNF